MDNGSLIRASYPGFELREEGDGMPTLRGVFSPFNEWAEIDSVFEGHFMERVAPGAFKKTLKERRDKLKVLFNHGQDPSVGEKVLGPLADVGEDERGGFYEVPLLDTSYNRDLLPGLRAGLYGSSYRFTPLQVQESQRPERSEYNPEGIPERTITEAKVLEFGPVTFPAFTGATAHARSLTDEFVFTEFFRQIFKPDRLPGLVEQARAAALDDLDDGPEPESRRTHEEAETREEVNPTWLLE